MIIEQHKGKIYIFLNERDSSGKRKAKCTPAIHRFFIPEGAKIPKYDKEKLTIAKTEYESLDKKKILIAELDPKIPKHFLSSATIENSLEFDVSSRDQFVLSKPLMQDYADQVKIMYIDIEVDARKGFPDPEFAEYPVISVAACDSLSNDFICFVWRKDLKKSTKKINHLNATVHYFNNEREMLQAFCQYVRDQDPEILTGWNFIEFDMKYLANRFPKIRLKLASLSPLWSARVSQFGYIHVAGRELIDSKDLYQKFTYTKAFTGQDLIIERYSLAAVSKKELDHEEKEKLNIETLWERNLDKLVTYNLSDVDLNKKIIEKQDLFKRLEKLKSLTGCTWRQCFTESKMIDLLLLRNAHANRIVLPNKPTEFAEAKFQGALTIKPPAGLFKNVAVLDLKSVYPSVIVMANISPECITKKKSPKTAEIYDGKLLIEKEPEGFVSLTIQNLLKERIIIKKKLNAAKFGSNEYNNLFDTQWAVKVLANSIYGCFGYPRSRLYDITLAGAVTWCCRKALRQAKLTAKHHGLKTLYGDTDSIFVQLPEELTFKDSLVYANRLADLINIDLENMAKSWNIRENRLEIEFEKLFYTILFTGAKKKYVGLLTYKDKPIDKTLNVTGFEGIKRDTPEFARRMLRNLYTMILDLKPKPEIIAYAKSELKSLKTQPLHVMGITQRISRDIDKYKNLPIHVQGAKYANDHLNTHFARTDYVTFAYIKSCNPYPPTKVLSFDEETKIPSCFIPDIDKMADRLVFLKLKPIFETLRWSLAELHGQQSLASYFQNKADLPDTG